jgi:hypothetical protein
VESKLVLADLGHSVHGSVRRGCRSGKGTPVPARALRAPLSLLAQELVDVGVHARDRLALDATHERVPLLARVPEHETVSDRYGDEGRMTHATTLLDTP